MPSGQEQVLDADLCSTMCPDSGKGATGPGAGREKIDEEVFNQTSRQVVAFGSDLTTT